MRNARLRFFLLATPLVAVACWLLVVLTPPAGADQTSGIRWLRDYERAVQVSSKERKPIVVDIYTDWCKWCKKMDENTFADPKVIAESRKHVYLRLNAEKEPDGIKLQERFQVNSYPTVLVLDENGEEIDRITGYQTAEPFRKSLHAILNGTDSLAYLKGREAEDGSDLQNLFMLGRKYFGRYDFAQAQLRFGRIAEQDPTNNKGLTDVALFYKSICSANLGQIEESLSILRELPVAFPKSELLADATLISGEIYLRSGRTSEARKVYQAFLDKYPKHHRAGEVRALLTEI